MKRKLLSKICILSDLVNDVKGEKVGKIFGGKMDIKEEAGDFNEILRLQI